MTLPSTVPNNQPDDDSDIFGPPRTSPPTGNHHHRSRVPMISPKLRQREERKRILQLCAHKLERIKDSETNLRRSVCINNTYCRLTDELRREKENRDLANSPKTDSNAESAKDNNNRNPCSNCGIDNSNHQPSNEQAQNDINNSIENPENSLLQQNSNQCRCQMTMEVNNNNYDHSNQPNETNSQPASNMRKRPLMSNNIVNDLEILDRELSAINSPMPLIDPEITQGAEQLEKAVSSRKRQRSEDESDRLVREALSQFYIPPQRLISAIEDCPLDIVNVGSLSPKIQKMSNSGDLELDFDLNQNQKEFEVIMDALRLGSPSPTPSVGNDSCGQAAMLSESSNVFHNLVVTSLET